MRSVATVRTPVPTCRPEGNWLAAPTWAPGWRTVWYIKSSKMARLRLKPVVLTLARLLEITSILVCCDSRPVLAIQSERIMIYILVVALAARGYQYKINWWKVWSWRARRWRWHLV